MPRKAVKNVPRATVNRSSLESLPIEVLELLVGFIGGWSTFLLSSLSGSRALSSKLRSPRCVRTLSFNFNNNWNGSLSKNRTILRTSPKIFPSLSRLEICMTPGSGRKHLDLDPYSFPSSLTSLTIVHPNALEMWFLIEPASSLAGLMHGYGRPVLVDIGSILPNLCELKLVSGPWTYIAERHEPLSQAFNRFITGLPSRLEHLTIYCYAPTPMQAMKMPPNIKTLDFNQVYFEAPVTHVNPHLTSLSIAHEGTLSFDASNMPSLTALRLFGPSLSSANLLKLSPLPLSSLTICSSFDGSGLKKLPAGLTKLVLKNCEGKTSFSDLPRSLMHFATNFSSQTSFDIHNLPPKLAHLALAFNKNVLGFQWSSLPRSLTYLDLVNVHVTGDEDLDTDLPRDLAYLGIQATQKSPAFSASFINYCLPKSLTALSLAPRYSFWLGNSDSVDFAELDRVDFSTFPRLFALSLGSGPMTEQNVLNLPNQISIFNCATVAFNGHLIDREATHFSSLNPTPSFSRSLSESFRLHSSSQLSKSHWDFGGALPGIKTTYFSDLDPQPESPPHAFIHLKPGNPTAYPKTLQHLEYHLSEPPIHQIVWFTPMLTSIKGPVDALPAIDFPKTLVKISVNRIGISDFTPFKQLRSLTLLQSPIDSHIKLPPEIEEITTTSMNENALTRLKSLRKLKVLHPKDFRSSILKHLPPRLTSLKLRSKDSRSSSYYTDARIADISVPESLSSSASLLALTVLDLPYATMNIKGIEHLPPTLTSLILHDCTATVSDLKLALLDLESCMEDSPSPVTTKGSKKSISLKARSKARRILERVSGDVFVKIIFEAYLVLHCPLAKLSFFDYHWLPRDSGFWQAPHFQLQFRVSPTPAPIQVPYSTLPKCLKSFVFCNRDTSAFSEATLQADFSKSLPPLLVVLDIVSPLYPLSIAAAKHLPSTLTQFSFNAKLWNAPTFSLLPPGLQSLEIWYIRKWNPRYTKSIAHLEKLAHLRIECDALNDYCVPHLPSSIRRLTLLSNSLTPLCLTFLPKGLESLAYCSKHLTFQELVRYLSIVSPESSSRPPMLKELTFVQRRSRYTGPAVDRSILLTDDPSNLAKRQDDLI